MRLISAHAGKLLTLDSELSPGCARRGFVTGLKPLDNLLPGRLFAGGAVHELLNEPRDPQALTFAMLLAGSSTGASPVFHENALTSANVGSALRTVIGNPQGAVRRADPTLFCHPERSEGSGPTSQSSQMLRCAQHDTSASILYPQPSTLNPPRALVILDPAGEIYPPAIAAMGILLDRVYFLHPRDKADQLWAIAECLRCSAVGAVVAAPPALSRTDARKLQLAAERGGGVGILLRTFGQSLHYAAATRWLVRPAPGERTIQRWNIQLLHAPGGQVGQSITLESSREILQLRVVTPQSAPATQTSATPQVS
jgi:hypothetical protein